MPSPIVAESSILKGFIPNLFVNFRPPLFLIILTVVGYVLVRTNLTLIVFIIITSILRLSCDRCNSCRIVIIELEEPVEVLCTNTRHSELCVVNFNAVGLFKPFCKLVCIRLFAVGFYAGVELVAGKTVAVRHRVAERNVVQLIAEILFTLAVGKPILEARHSRAHRRSENAKQHRNNHGQGKGLKTHLLEFHCFLPF